MNQNIKTIAEKCNLPSLKIHGKNYEKFAEMLISECLKMCEQTGNQKSSIFSEQYSEGRKMGIEVAVNTIKEHFNIK
jgi:hypothetical protein